MSALDLAMNLWYDDSAATNFQPVGVSTATATPLGCVAVHAASMPNAARILDSSLTALAASCSGQKTTGGQGEVHEASTGGDYHQTTMVPDSSCIPASQY